MSTDRERWLLAAGELLERHPRGRLQHALNYMLTDEILGSRALTIPGFAKVADELLARHHARSRRTGRPQPAAQPGEIGWAAARELLERAVQRHGRDDRAGALAELSEHSQLLGGVRERVRWSSLCDSRCATPRAATANYGASCSTTARVGRRQHERNNERPSSRRFGRPAAQP